MQREENGAMQQAAVYRAYPVAKHAARIFAKGRVVPNHSSFSDVHPPLGVVFSYPHLAQGHSAQVYQDLRGCRHSEPFSVVGINQESLDRRGGRDGGPRKALSRVQLFGTTEVRLNKNADLFNVGDEVYARFPSQEEIDEVMVTGKYPLSLIVCKKSIAPGSHSIAELLLQYTEDGAKTAGQDLNEKKVVADFDRLKKFMKDALERTVFERSYREDAALKYTVGDAFSVIERQLSKVQILKLVAYLERDTEYARHKRLGKALKPTRPGASKLLIFLDP